MQPALALPSALPPRSTSPAARRSTAPRSNPTTPPSGLRGFALYMAGMQPVSGLVEVYYNGLLRRREPSFGHGILELKSAYEATFTW